MDAAALLGHAAALLLCLVPRQDARGAQCHIPLCIYTYIHVPALTELTHSTLFLEQRPLGEAYAVAVFAVVLITGLVWLLVHGLGLHFLYLALFPYLVAGTGLAYSFDYAPHRPHEVDRCVLLLLFDPIHSIDHTIPHPRVGFAGTRASTPPRRCWGASSTPTRTATLVSSSCARTTTTSTTSTPRSPSTGARMNGWMDDSGECGSR